MDPVFLAATALALSVAACILAGLCPLLARRLVLKAMGKEARKALDLIVDLKSWTARAAGTVRHVRNRLGYRDDDGEGGEDAPAAGGVQLPAFVLQVAQGAGLDVAKLQAGDMGEWQKGLQLLKGLNLAGGDKPAAAAVAGGDFL